MMHRLRPGSIVLMAGRAYGRINDQSSLRSVSMDTDVVTGETPAGWPGQPACMAPVTAIALRLHIAPSLTWRWW